MNDTSSNAGRQVLVFLLADRLYGIEISCINSIIYKDMMITRVPNSPDYIIGVINLRGDIVPIMDLAQKLGMKVSEETSETRIIIIEYEDITMGFVIDKVNEVVDFGPEDIENASSLNSEVGYALFTGVGKYKDNALAIFNVEQLVIQDQNIMG